MGGGKIVTLPVGPKTDGASDKKIVTLPAPNAGTRIGNTGINGGKIATLPGTTVGKVGTTPEVIKTNGQKPDIKVTTFPAKRIVDAPVNKPKFESRIERREPIMVKQNPSQGGGRRIMGMGGNNGSSFAQMNQGGGRRGFMR